MHRLSRFEANDATLEFYQGPSTHTTIVSYRYPTWKGVGISFLQKEEDPGKRRFSVVVGLENFVLFQLQQWPG